MTRTSRLYLTIEGTVEEFDEESFADVLEAAASTIRDAAEEGEGFQGTATVAGEEIVLHWLIRTTPEDEL